MSTVTSSSPPGYVPMKKQLEDCTLDLLVYELALRLIGPEKAKSLKSTGIDVGALCRALTAMSSMDGYVGTMKQIEEADYITATPYHPCVEKDYAEVLWKQSVVPSTLLINPIQLVELPRDTKSLGTHGQAKCGDGDCG